MSDPLQPIPAPFPLPARAPDAAAAAEAPVASLAASPIAWPDAARHAAFDRWLSAVAPAHGLRAETLRAASADASFRRYFRIDTTGGASCIVMDAPPAQEDCRPFVKVAGLLNGAGLLAPQVLAWDEAQGFMLLSDLGARTLMEVINPLPTPPGTPLREPDAATHALYLKAVDALIAWQLASRPGVLPPYDEALLQRELALFPDWYLAQHRGVAVQGDIRATLDKTFALIVQQNLAAPQVYVHRDFMPRNLIAPTLGTDVSSLPLGGAGSPWGGPAANLNLIAPTLGTGVSSLPPGGAGSPWGGPAANLMMSDSQLGILDFQDAVFGPISYDIASLMRDAFLTWDEPFVLDITVRYWQAAKKAGLLGAGSASGWGDDFGEFYRGVEWMGLQRHLKVAGIFARLTLRDGKPKYLADAPRFIGYIRHTAHRYRALGPFLQLIDEVEGLQAASGYAFGRV